MKNKINVRLPDVIGKGYKDFWNFKGRYRICKGSRASKKSKTAALFYIYNMMKYPKANLLVVRKVYRTLKDSCFAELKWAINRLGVSELWEYKESPLEITYKPTGQKIYFRGLDDPLKITSITVQAGVLCWLWIEEAYEITKEQDFDMLDECIRGETPGSLFKQVTLTFNPWNEKHWIKKRFFDASPSADILAKTTNYMKNEFLDEADRRLFENMKKNNPRRYRVAGLGEWGIAEGLIYENWEERAFIFYKRREYDEFMAKNSSSGDSGLCNKGAGGIGDAVIIDNLKPVFGLDFGYTNDPSALFCAMADIKTKELYVFDEIYEKGLTNKALFEKIFQRGYSKEKIRADSSEPKSIDELYSMGMYNLRAARKGKDSINSGIQYIQDFKIYIHPKCVNFITEIGNYTWEKDKFGGRINRPIDDFNHLMDAMRYGMEEFLKGDTFSFE